MAVIIYESGSRNGELVNFSGLFFFSAVMFFVIKVVLAS